MENKNDIGVSIKQRLAVYNDSPDDLVWTNIEKKLKKKKKKRFLILLFSGLALFTAIIIISRFQPFDKENFEEASRNESSSRSNHYTPSSTNNNNNNNHKAANQTTDNITTKFSIYQDSVNLDIKHSDKEQLKTYNDSIFKSNTYNSTKPSNKRNVQSGSGKHNYTFTKQNKKTSEITTDQRSPSKHSQSTNRTNTLSEQKIPHDTDSSILKKQDSILQNNVTANLVSEEKKQAEKKSKEKIEDSILAQNKHKWRFAPHTSLSYYGAFGSKSSKNTSLNYGFLLSYPATNTIFLRIGARKLDLQQTINDNDINVSYIQIPFDLKYAPMHKNINPYINGGFSYFMLDEATINNERTNDYNPTFSGHVGLGVEHQLFDKFYLFLETNFTYQFEPIAQSKAVNPFILSLNTGLEYRF